MDYSLSKNSYFFLRYQVDLVGFFFFFFPFFEFVPIWQRNTWEFSSVGCNTFSVLALGGICSTLYPWVTDLVSLGGVYWLFGSYNERETFLWWFCHGFRGHQFWGMAWKNTFGFLHTLGMGVDTEWHELEIVSKNPQSPHATWWVWWGSPERILPPSTGNGMTPPIPVLFSVLAMVWPPLFPILAMVWPPHTYCPQYWW